MKVALLVPGGVDRSGTGKVIPCLLWLIERLAGDGHDVHVFALRQEERPGSWPLLGARVHNIGRRPARLRTLGAIWAEHRKGRFDVIHAFWTNPGAAGAAASKLLGVPLVLTLPGGDVVGLTDIGYGTQLWRRGRLELRLAARQAIEVNTPSRFMRDLAAPIGIDAAVVPLGVDLIRWPPVPPRPRNISLPVRLLHVASLNRVKDQPTLLTAMLYLREAGIPAELTIVGLDTLGGEIQQMAERMGLPARFLGELPHAEMRPLFEWADLIIVSSRHEAGHLVTLEAAVAGVPTVGTRVGHIADLSPDAAVAVPISDAKALSEAVARLAVDEPRRLELAAAAQAVAIRIDADYTARTFLDTYRRVRTNRRQGDEPKSVPPATTPSRLSGSGG